METFKFKKFNLKQNEEVFKVGTDGVLLGAWTDTSHVMHALDLGTGTGLLALMLAQKNETVIIDAVEVQAEACRIAEANFMGSPWKKRLTLIQSSFQDLLVGSDFKYDLIITNPPFFIESLKNPASGKSIARHADSLSMEEILAGSAKLLQASGHLSIIYPYREAVLFEEFALKYNLYCRRKLLVRPLPAKAFERTLMEFGFGETNCREEEIIIEKGSRHHYSDEYKKLTGDFYLYFLH